MWASCCRVDTYHTGRIRIASRAHGAADRSLRPEGIITIIGPGHASSITLYNFSFNSSNTTALRLRGCMSAHIPLVLPLCSSIHCHYNYSPPAHSAGQPTTLPLTLPRIKSGQCSDPSTTRCPSEPPVTSQCHIFHTFLQNTKLKCVIHPIYEKLQSLNHTLCC